MSHWLAPDGQDYDVIVQLPQSAREVVDDLGDLYLTSTRLDADGLPLLVPLRQVAELEQTMGPLQIKRLNLQRRISLQARAQGQGGGVDGDIGPPEMHEGDLVRLAPAGRVGERLQERVRGAEPHRGDPDATPREAGTP